MAVIPPWVDEGEGIVEVEEAHYWLTWSCWWQWQGWWMEGKRRYYDYDWRRSEGVVFPAESILPTNNNLGIKMMKLQ